MIRRYEDTDRERVIEIWKDRIVRAHHFIDEEYWNIAYDKVRDVYLKESDTYLYEEDYIIKGFISIISDDSIWGVFVDDNYRYQGIGSNLIENVKEDYNLLSISIYKRNESVMWLVKKLGFIYEYSQFDTNTNQEEMVFVWRR